MRNQDSATPSTIFAVSDEIVERLARLEEQMRHVVNAVEKLTNRDAELDMYLRTISDRFTAALATQAESLRESVRQIGDKFMTRDDWAFWKNILTGGLLALIALGWSVLIGAIHH